MKNRFALHMALLAISAMAVSGIAGASVNSSPSPAEPQHMPVPGGRKGRRYQFEEPLRLHSHRDRKPKSRNLAREEERRRKQAARKAPKS